MTIEFQNQAELIEYLKKCWPKQWRRIYKDCVQVLGDRIIINTNYL